MINENGLFFHCDPIIRTSTRFVDVRSVPDGFTVHYLNSLHLDRNWLGAGYHYFIKGDGSIENMRGEKYIGAGCDPQTICICVEGQLSSAQKEKIRELILRISNEYLMFEAVIISKALKAKCKKRGKR